MLNAMHTLLNHPLLVALVSFPALWLSAWLGSRFLATRWKLDPTARGQLDVIRTAALTLLGLLIAFCFSMAVDRYEKRQELEQAEANAIAAVYLHADLLPPGDRAKLLETLAKYLEQRIAAYELAPDQVHQLQARTDELARELWRATVSSASQPTATVALVVGAVGDVFDAAHASRAARLNRIPLAAWSMMFAIAICCSLMIGYGTQHGRAEGRLLPILPLLVTISFYLIADIDSARGGAVLVEPENLRALTGIRSGSLAPDDP